MPLCSVEHTTPVQKQPLRVGARLATTDTVQLMTCSLMDGPACSNNCSIQHVPCTLPVDTAQDLTGLEQRNKVECKPLTS